MLSFLLGCALAAAPISVAAPDFRAVGIDPSRGALLAEHFGQQLVSLGFTIVGPRQVAAVLGQERQRELLGCKTDDSSCMAELAAALGSEAIITGSVAVLSSGSLRLSITIVAGGDARPLSVMSSSVSSEDAAFEALTEEAPRMAKELFEKLRPQQKLVLPSRGVRRYTWVPGAVGVASLAVGFGLLGSAWADSDTLRAGPPAPALTLSAGRELATRGALKQGVGGALIGVGVGALVTTGLMFMLGADTPLQVIGGLHPDGATLALVWRLP